jgi:probable DNA repair protein
MVNGMAMSTTVTESTHFDPISYEGLLTFDSRTTTVLTVNNRYARRIVSELSSLLGVPRQVVALPAILPWSSWVRQMSDQRAFTPEANMPSYVLDHFGAGLVWKQAIEHVERDAPLLDVQSAVRLAIEADRLMDEWALSVPALHETPDYQRFGAWRKRYRALLMELGAEDANLAFEGVCEAFESGRLPCAGQIVLAGFSEISPRMARLLDCLVAAGCHIYRLKNDRVPAQNRTRVLAGDAIEEWEAAVRWAHERLRHSPEQRVAIVNPNLEQDAVLAHRLLARTLQEPGASAPLAFNIAVARPLMEWPLVRAAIHWLDVIAAVLRDRAVSPSVAGAALLAGGCAAHAQEAGKRAVIDAAWRRNRVVNISLPELSQYLADAAPVLHESWVATMHLCEQAPNRQGAVAWAQTIREWLTTLGFPGVETLDSDTFQSLEAFDRVLTQFARQVALLGSIGVTEAIAILRRLLRETLFQPQRDPTSRLDVLGLLEAEGGHWDALWVMGLTDNVLPAAPRPNPLIPAAVLKAAQAPRATPERELQWAQGIFEDLVCCAPDVVVSHALHEGESELRPSPFIAGWPMQPIVSSAQAEAVESASDAAIEMEVLIDNQGPALLPQERIRGGVQVLDDHARNPLWAFVKYRLHARQLTDYAEPGESNARGIFLHGVMERVWRHLQSQDKLHESVEQGRVSAIVRLCADEAAQLALSDYSERLRQLEVTRACTVVEQWLEVEQKRPPFSVYELERRHVWQYKHLELGMQIDRIDQLADGRWLVIDYKSGNGSVDPRSSWTRSRPVDLQLPLYAAVLQQEYAQSQAESVAALVLAKLHARGNETRGLADIECFPGVAAVEKWTWPEATDKTWEQVLVDWRRAISMLADEFVSGVADNRVWSEQDLQYCDVKPFLRRFEGGV